ncbi:RICIN domain-containing protein [Kitasatospora sp. NPDC058162]|uniref:RICIN domain-containing protein n=1 Tax=Kitasatospora sp. NPDC058162 TaxID=3346362 RepID=UPI0036DE1B81
MNIRSSIAVLALGLGAGLLTAAPASASWFPPLSSDSTVEIRADFSGKCLEVADARTDDGAPVVEATCTGASNQQWNITDGYVLNVHSGKCLDLPGWNRNAGTAIDQWTCNQGDNQRWGHLDLTGGGMSIVNFSSGLLLETDGADTADGTPVIQWYSEYNDNQRFTLNPVG